MCHCESCMNKPTPTAGIIWYKPSHTHPYSCFIYTCTVWVCACLYFFTLFWLRLRNALCECVLTKIVRHDCVCFAKEVSIWINLKKHVHTHSSVKQLKSNRAMKLCNRPEQWVIFKWMSQFNRTQFSHHTAAIKINIYFFKPHPWVGS